MENFINVNRKILESIMFKIDVTHMQYVKIILGVDKSNCIEYTRELKDKNITAKIEQSIDLSIEESDLVFKNLDKHFKFPRFVQSLTVNCSFDKLPIITMEYHPLAKE